MSEHQQVPQRSRSKLTLAFICAGDPMNVRTWSGTPFHMLEALREEFDIRLVVRRPWARFFPFFRRGIRRLSGGKIDLYWSPFWTALASRQSVAEIRRSRSDIVFAVAITPICAVLTRTGNSVFVSDATHAAMTNYNPHISALSRGLTRSAKALETICIRDSFASLFPSTWARTSAIEDHCGSPSRLFQIPWGANLIADRITPPEDRSDNSWRLLFVGTNWLGKGGDIALATVAEIRRRGFDVHLDVVGSAPSPPRPTSADVTFHGFLDKNSAADREGLSELFRSAHLFILPTQFDAFPTVIAESASFAVPAVSYRTGGLPSNVKSGETGLLLGSSEGPTEFADAIIALLQDRARYVSMSNAALAFSRSDLNWAAWARATRTRLESQFAAEADRR